MHFDQIHDSLPVSESIDWLSKFFALAAVQAVLISVVILCGMIVQTCLGYYHYEIPVYLKEMFLIAYPQVLTFILLALFVHTMVSNKFVGHALVIGFFILIPILYRYGIENRLYLVGEITPYTYSDMNGYGHFVPALAWSISYWFFFCCLLGSSGHRAKPTRHGSFLVLAFAFGAAAFSPSDSRGDNFPAADRRLRRLVLLQHARAE